MKSVNIASNTCLDIDRPYNAIYSNYDMALFTELSAFNHKKDTRCMYITANFPSGMQYTIPQTDNSLQTNFWILELDVLFLLSGEDL